MNMPKKVFKTQTKWEKSKMMEWEIGLFSELHKNLGFLCLLKIFNYLSRKEPDFQDLNPASARHLTVNSGANYFPEPQYLDI